MQKLIFREVKQQLRHIHPCYPFPHATFVTWCQKATLLNLPHPIDMLNPDEDRTCFPGPWVVVTQGEC